jgi:hypothetical protein
MSTRFIHPTFNFKYAAQLSHGLNFSDEFIKIAELHLLKEYAHISGEHPDSERLVLLNPYIEDCLTVGSISSLEGLIYFKFGYAKVKICWYSRSGSIYQISEEHINTDDIKFKIEGLTTEIIQKLMQPKWTLFGRNYDEYIWKFRKDYQLKASEIFFYCADKQLSLFFEKKTGYKINKNTGVTLLPGDNTLFQYIKGKVSKLNIQLYNNHNWNTEFICWQSISGRIYDIGDEDIDCNDIRFSFESLDILLYNRQMHPGVVLPFKLANLGYNLVINRINRDCTLLLTVKKANETNRKILIKKIADFIENYNITSEKKDYINGATDSYCGAEQGKYCIEYSINLGSVGWFFLKELFVFLKKTDMIEEVTIN